METSVNDILLVIGLDFSVFLLLFVGFALYRKLRSQKVEIAIEVSVLQPYMNEAVHSSYEIAKKVVTMSLEDIYSEVGEWAFMYLSIQRFMAICIFLLALPGCSTLLVIYVYGNQSNTYQNIQKTGISNVMDDSEFLIAPAIFLVVFSLIIYVYGWIFLRMILKARPSNMLLEKENTTVMVGKIPKDFSTEFVNTILKKSLIQDFRTSVKSVYTLPQLIDPYKYYLKVKENEKKLKFLKFDLESTGKRPIVRNKCQKVDGIEYYEKMKKKNLQKVEEMKVEVRNVNAGVAFITFYNKTAARLLVMAGLNPTENLNLIEWECKTAPVSCDLIWENIGIDTSYGFFRKLLVNFMFILVFLVIITPSYLEGIIKKYMDYLNLTSLIVGTLAVSLPSLILIIYQLIILPPAVNFMVNQEKHTKKHTQVTSRLKKYFFFLIFYTLFFPILGVQFINFLLLLFSGDWELELGTKVNLTGQLFFVFLIHQAFLKNGFDLLVASKYIWSATKAFMATTQTEKQASFEAEPFEFDFELAVSLNTFCITCSMSIIYPLILLPGLLFFTIRVRIIQYYVHKHNILAVFYVDKQSSAFPSLLTIMFGIFLSGFLMQILTGATLAFCKDPDYSFFGQIVIIVAFCVFILLCLFIRVVAKKGRLSAMMGQEAFVAYDDENSYKHPMDRLS